MVTEGDPSSSQPAAQGGARRYSEDLSPIFAQASSPPPQHVCQQKQQHLYQTTNDPFCRRGRFQQSLPCAVPFRWEVAREGQIAHVPFVETNLKPRSGSAVGALLQQLVPRVVLRLVASVIPAATAGPCSTQADAGLSRSAMTRLCVWILRRKDQLEDHMSAPCSNGSFGSGRKKTDVAVLSSSCRLPLSKKSTPPPQYHFALHTQAHGTTHLPNNSTFPRHQRPHWPSIVISPLHTRRLATLESWSSEAHHPACDVFLLVRHSAKRRASTDLTQRTRIHSLRRQPCSRTPTEETSKINVVRITCFKQNTNEHVRENSTIRPPHGHGFFSQSTERFVEFPQVSFDTRPTPPLLSPCSAGPPSACSNVSNILHHGMHGRDRCTETSAAFCNSMQPPSQSSCVSCSKTFCAWA